MTFWHLVCISVFQKPCRAPDSNPFTPPLPFCMWPSSTHHPLITTCINSLPGDLCLQYSPTPASIAIGKAQTTRTQTAVIHGAFRHFIRWRFLEDLLWPACIDEQTQIFIRVEWVPNEHTSVDDGSVVINQASGALLIYCASHSYFALIQLNWNKDIKHAKHFLLLIILL